MKVFASVVLAILLTAPIYLSAQLGSQAEEKEPGLKCYLPYSVKKDHMVMGCEVSGYHMRYDLAQKIGVFMILLPDDANSIEEAVTYFSIQTFAFDGKSLKELLDADVKDILQRRPGTNVVKNLAHKIPLAAGGNCIGAELAFPKQSSAFPSESFYFCDAGSKNYAVMFSLGARSKEAMDGAYPSFMKWIDVPHRIKDATILEER